MMHGRLVVPLCCAVLCCTALCCSSLLARYLPYSLRPKLLLAWNGRRSEPATARAAHWLRH